MVAAEHSPVRGAGTDKTAGGYVLRIDRGGMLQTCLQYYLEPDGSLGRELGALRPTTALLCEVVAMGTRQAAGQRPGSVRCSVGRLGVVDWPAGTYVYTGSARRAFEARLARHVRATKKLRWHIDYLLAAPGVRIRNIVRSGQAECRFNQATSGVGLVAGFGASDYSPRPGPRPAGPPRRFRKRPAFSVRGWLRRASQVSRSALSGAAVWTLAEASSRRPRDDASERCGRGKGQRRGHPPAAPETRDDGAAARIDLCRATSILVDTFEVEHVKDRDPDRSAMG